MTESLRVAVAQFAPGADRAANLAGIRSLAGEAAREGSELVLFPEYSAFFGGRMGGVLRHARCGLREWRGRAKGLTDLMLRICKSRVRRPPWTPDCPDLTGVRWSGQESCEEGRASESGETAPDIRRC